MNQKLWNIIRHYYHNKDAEVWKCVVTFFENGEAHILCSYTRSYGAGGISPLNAQEASELLAELGAAGIPHIPKTTGIIITMEVGSAVNVQHTYLI